LAGRQTWVAAFSEKDPGKILRRFANLVDNWARLAPVI
jgi:hypothetical protein